jgi:peptidoglycan/LPS O-acetylase OafA/YrhL
VSWIVLFQFPNWSFEVKQCFSILLTALATPWIFYLTRHVYWDRVLGELGYPIYIVHVTIGQVSDRVLEQLGWSERGLVLLVLTLPASWLIYRFVDQPIDAMRQKRLKSVSS